MVHSQVYALGFASSAAMGPPARAIAAAAAGAAPPKTEISPNLAPGPTLARPGWGGAPDATLGAELLLQRTCLEQLAGGEPLLLATGKKKPPVSHFPESIRFHIPRDPSDFPFHDSGQVTSWCSTARALSTALQCLVGHFQTAHQADQGGTGRQSGQWWW